MLLALPTIQIKTSMQQLPHTSEEYAKELGIRGSLPIAKQAHLTATTRGKSSYLCPSSFALPPDLLTTAAES